VWWPRPLVYDLTRPDAGLVSAPIRQRNEGRVPSCGAINVSGRRRGGYVPSTPDIVTEVVPQPATRGTAEVVEDMLRSIQRQHHVIAVTNPRAHVRAGHHGSGDGAAAIHRAWVHQRGGHTEPPSGKGGEAWAAFAREEGGGVLAVELVSVGGLSGSAQELGGVLAVQGVGVGVDRALGADLALKSPLALDALLALCSGWPLLPLLPGGAGLAL